MRLLVVGHSYVTAFAQAKYAAMKAIAPELSLKLVIPHVTHHVFGSYRPQVADGLSSDDLAILQAFGGRTNMTYLLNPIALRSVVREFDPTHIHIEEDPHSAVGAETVALAKIVCPRARISFFLWDNLNRVPAPPLNLVKQQLTRFGLSRANLVVCGNEVARDLLPAKGYLGPAETIPQIGLSPEIKPRAVSTSEATPPTIGFLGRLVEEKGLNDLLSALELVSDLPWRLAIRGNGPLRSEIEGRWKAVFGPRLQYQEAVAQDEVASELALVDIFVLPSFSTVRWQEQFGLTLAQAMLAGCACIGSSSGAIPDTLGGCGLIFPERNVKALAGALRRLLQSPSERDRLGRSASVFAATHYTSEAIARRYLRAFETLN